MARMEAACPLCERVGAGRFICENAVAVAFHDAYPVSSGHALIVPRRHVADFFSLTGQEQAALWSLLPIARLVLDASYQPAAYNIGVNAGQATGFDNRLLLRPGVADHLVRLNGLLRPLFYREWAVMVARMNKLPEAELERFLFGSERTPLDAVRRPLRNLQENRCFYCNGRISGPADMDHFIPWPRYPDDGLDNLVAAHPTCTNSKRDFLASADHVERWAERTRTLNTGLAAVARDAGWPRDTDRSGSVATAIYLRLPATTRLWSRPDEFVPIDSERIARALAG